MSTKLLDLELIQPAELPSVPSRYQFVRLLVRLRGAPVGYVQVQNRLAELEPATLRSTAVAQLGSSVWTELRAQGWLDEPNPGRNGAAQPPQVSVVVCTRDRAGELEGCLASLADQRYPRYEVLVVDNASRDRATRDVAARFAVRYVREERPGLDWARNRGVLEARSSIVAFTDDDARPDPGWLAAIAAGFTAAEVDAVTGMVVPAELETDAQWLFEDVYLGMNKGFQPGVHSCRGLRQTYMPNIYGTGCNMAFRKQALDRIGGFDPALDVGTATGGGGDLDAFQRLIEAGGVLVYRPDAIVRHIHRRTFASLRRQLSDNGRGFSAVLFATLLRARGRDRLRVVLAYCRWMWCWCLRRLVRRLLRRERMPLAFIRAELVGGLLGPWLYWVARRRARQLGGIAS